MNETIHTYKIIQNGQKANEQYILFITVQIQKWSLNSGQKCEKARK